jgi:hypothetical protein
MTTAADEPGAAGRRIETVRGRVVFDPGAVQRLAAVGRPQAGNLDPGIPVEAHDRRSAVGRYAGTVGGTGACHHPPHPGT